MAITAGEDPSKPLDMLRDKNQLLQLNLHCVNSKRPVALLPEMGCRISVCLCVWGGSSKITVGIKHNLRPN